MTLEETTVISSVDAHPFIQLILAVVSRDSPAKGQCVLTNCVSGPDSVFINTITNVHDGLGAFGFHFGHNYPITDEPMVWSRIAGGVDLTERGALSDDEEHLLTSIRSAPELSCMTQFVLSPRHAYLELNQSPDSHLARAVFVGIITGSEELKEILMNQGI